MILRDMTQADLDVLFDIQDDDIARHMAGFTSADGGDRDRYVARFRGFLADDKIINKVILVDDEIVGSIASFVLEGDTEVTIGSGATSGAAASPRPRSPNCSAR
jgi:[ribosomal protein S5]-alanine N-acetyltransferase